MIEAENFDNGGEGVAYHDTTPAKKAAPVRTTESGVDIKPPAIPAADTTSATSTPANGSDYTVNVNSSGNYDFDARVADVGAGGRFTSKSTA